MTSSDRAQDLELLRRFEPQLRLNRGELFQPMDVDAYLAETDLVLHRRGERPTVLRARPEVTQEFLAASDWESHAGTLHLRLIIRPLKALQLVQFHARSELREFSKGVTRHARVGLTARLLDVAFRISLVARGRVPGGTAAAAALVHQAMRESAPDPIYYGRVVRTRSYTVLQYWMFYAYNDYRSHYHGANDHEGDWEAVSVFLDEGAPDGPSPAWVAYANHDATGADLRRRWDDPELVWEGEHPVVFAGAGSHAAYFSAGEYVIRIEMPLLARFNAMIGAIRSVWRTALRQGGSGHGNGNSGGELNIAFVDYARGDGLKIGPGGDQGWSPRMLDDQPALVHYRGLWGRFTDDPIRGEDAPAGPRFNRDGSVRVTWYDPVGGVALTATPPPSREAPTTEMELARLREEWVALSPRIAEAETEATRLGTRVDGLRETSTTSRRLQESNEQLAEARERVRRLREECSEIELLSRSLELRLSRLTVGDHGDPRAHLQRPALPQGPSRLRMRRIAETWSAISAGLLLLVMGVVVILYHAALLPFLLLFGAFLFAESLFHRRVAVLVHGIVVALTLATLAVLIYQFWWQIGVGVALALGVAITWANLRELTRS